MNPQYTYKIKYIDVRKLCRVLGYDNDETEHDKAKRIDTAVDQRILDNDDDLREQYEAKLGAVTYYGPDSGIFGLWLFVADLLQEAGIELELEWK